MLKFPSLNVFWSFLFLLLLRSETAVGQNASSAPDEPSESKASQHLQKLEKELQFIAYESVLWNRAPYFRDEEPEIEREWKKFEELREKDWEISELSRLCLSENPRIVTLALIGLLAKETQAVIPPCIGLLENTDDAIPAFNHHVGMPPGTEPSYAVKRLSVNHLAIAILGQIDDKFLVYSPLRTMEPMPKTPIRLRFDLNEWWKQRKENRDWLAWYDYLYMRAHQGSSYRPPEAEKDFQRLRKTVNALPPMTRAWTLLQLNSAMVDIKNAPGYRFITLAERIDAAKQIGPEALLNFIRTGQRLGINDPDEPYDSEKQPMVVAYFRNFIDHHAASIFAETHGDALFDLEIYRVAVAVKPSLLDKYLDLVTASPDSSGDDIGTAMAMLASLGDSDKIDTAIDCLYSQPDEQYGGTAFLTFLHELVRLSPANWQGIVKAFVADIRFEDVQPNVVYETIVSIEKLLGEKLAIDQRVSREYGDLMRDFLRVHFELPAFDIPALRGADLKLDKPIWSLEVEGQLVSCGNNFVLSPDGKELAGVFGHFEERAHVFDTTNGKMKLVGDKLDHPCYNVCYSGDGRLQVSDSTVLHSPTGSFSVEFMNDRVPLLRCYSAQKELWGRPYRRRFPATAAISPDGKWIICNDGFTKDIDVVDAADGRNVYKLVGHSSTPLLICVANDSRRLISLGEDNRVIIWDLLSGILQKKYRSSNPYAQALCLSNDGTQFYLASPNNQLIGYSVNDGSPQFKIVSDHQSFCAVTPSIDGTRLYTVRGFSSQPNLVECWELPQP
jgi:hypothetical protein